MDYFLIVLGIILIPLSAQLYVKYTYKKYLHIKNNNNLSGFEVARKILDENNLKDIHIVETSGNLSDHYDPSRKVIRLSKDIFNGTSIASSSIAAHEAGHAIQDKSGYIFFKIRALIFPLVNFTSRIAYIIIIIGFILEFANLIYLGIFLVLFGILFQLITLPLEINASSRAKNEIKKFGLLSVNEIEGSNSMLTAAAFTYIAGLLSSILELIRLLLLTGNRRD